jgi:hypothetical protein
MRAEIEYYPRPVLEIVPHFTQQTYTRLPYLLKLWAR